MRCPVCDAENADTALECQLCGKVLLREEPPAPAAAGETLSGLERTSADATPAPDVIPPFAELERTSISAPGLQVDVQPIDIERSDVVSPEGAASFWDNGAPDLTLDRAEDDGVRTAAPAGDGLCAYCGEYSLDVLCANCGQRRDRFTSPPPPPPRASGPKAAGGERLLCPACFGRVPPGPRCIECGVPFPPSMGGAEP
jgi:hypothetical protein